MLLGLIKAYGVMILELGIFHTDPHPGNLLALHPAYRGEGAESQQAVLGLIDFGQAKQLEFSEKLKYAYLVRAMASRNREIVRALGLSFFTLVL